MRIVTLLLVLLLGLDVSTVTAQLVGDSFSKANQTKKAKFYYVYDGVPGFVDKGPSGEVEGFLAEIMRQFESYVLNTHGITVTSEFRQVPNKDFKIFMSDIKNGKGGVFGLSNVSIKEERKKDYSFSPPYMNNVSVLVSSSKVPTVTNMDDLPARFNAMKAYSVAGSTYYQRLMEIKEKYHPDMEIVSLSSVDEVMNTISKTDGGYAVVDLHYYLQSLKTHPIKRHPVGDKGEDKFGVIMPLSNDWQPVIKEFFNSGFIGGPEYRKLIAENLGKGALRLMEGSE